MKKLMRRDSLIKQHQRETREGGIEGSHLASPKTVKTLFLFPHPITHYLTDHQSPLGTDDAFGLGAHRGPSCGMGVTQVSRDCVDETTQQQTVADREQPLGERQCARPSE